MDYDKIIEHIGETSKWNLINLGLLWLPPTMAGLLVLQNSFAGMTTECSKSAKHDHLQLFLLQRFPHLDFGVKCPANRTTPRITTRDSTSPSSIRDWTMEGGRSLYLPFIGGKN